jgi:hypothetical protein
LSFRGLKPADLRFLFLLILRHISLLDDVGDQQETGGRLLKEGENDESRVHGLDLIDTGLHLMARGAISSTYPKWFPPSFPDI